MNYRFIKLFLVLIITLTFIFAPHMVVVSSEQNNLPNITILATGGTIAGTASSSTIVNYQAATVGVEALIKQCRNWKILPMFLANKLFKLLVQT